ncbi:MAG TPA: hypothetical protein VFK06_07360 [Candidatus Angelobacter sp.]|nr:hypothetical protein [Candidatus Angelobacter sp.]
MKDWLLYVAIAVLIMVLVWMFEIHQARTGGSPHLPLKWLSFAGMTAVVFWQTLQSCRPLWEMRKFWILLGLFFTVHSVLGVLVLMRIRTVPLLLLAVIITGAEYLLLGAYLGFFFD